MAFSVNLTIAGLTSVAIGIPAAGPTPISGKLTLPAIPEGDSATSAVVVTVTQTPNGGSPTTIFTGVAGARGFSLVANCAALDTIGIAMTSAAAVDQQLNTIKTTVSVG